MIQFTLYGLNSIYSKSYINMLYKEYVEKDVVENSKACTLICLFHSLTTADRSSYYSSSILTISSPDPKQN